VLGTIEKSLETKSGLYAGSVNTDLRKRYAQTVFTFWTTFLFTAI